MFFDFFLHRSWIQWRCCKMQETSCAIRGTDWHKYALSSLYEPCHIVPPFFFQLKIDRKAGDAALIAMTTNVANRLDGKTRKSEFLVVLERDCSLFTSQDRWYSWWSLQTNVNVSSSSQWILATVLVGYLSSSCRGADRISCNTSTTSG